ncbi:MAG: integrase arm-type DNA-binding domain-containing protein, partial [Pseudomonadota bacterium]
MPLSDLEIRSAKASDKDKKLFDGGGLYLLVTKTGSKLWKLKYRIHGKEKKLSLGAYPLVSLKDARLMRDEAKRQLQDGQDPSEIKRAEKQDAKLSSEQTFGLIAQDYLDYLKKDGRAEATLKKEQWLARQLLPALGTRPIKEITSRELLVILKKPEKAGKRETARRLRSFASRVFRHGIPEYCEVDPTVFLKGKLASPETKHHAAITNAVDLGKLLRAIDGYNGEPATAVALKLTPHVFQRPGEVRSMRWAEIDFEQAV